MELQKYIAVLIFCNIVYGRIRHQFPSIAELKNRLNHNTTRELKLLPHLKLIIHSVMFLPYLEKLSINSSNMSGIDEETFQALHKAEFALILDNRNIQLIDGMFKGCSLYNVALLSLAYNEISHLPEHIFEYTKVLQTLNLASNKIRDLQQNVFFSLTRLQTLNLENNLLTTIHDTSFQNLKNLEILNLKNNKIAFIDAKSFRTLFKLKEIILANNYYDLPKNDIPSSIFSNNQELKKLDFSNNRITVIDYFRQNINLTELDLSYNQISYLSFDEIFTPASAIHINLTHNCATTLTYIENSTRTVMIKGNPINCNCQIYNLVRYIEESTHPTTEKLIITEADSATYSSPNDINNFFFTQLNSSFVTCSLQELGIKGRFTDKCSYRFRPVDKSLIINCSNANFTKPPEIILPKAHNFYNQTVIYLQNNFLASGPTENMGYENVTNLFLYSNTINEITWIPPKLQVLELHNNNISYLNYEVLTKLNSSTVKRVSLGNNPWNCNCSGVNLKTFVENSSKISNKIDAKSIKCEDRTILISLNYNDFCPNHTNLILGLGVTFSVTALLFAIMMVLYYRFRQEVKVWLFAHNIFLWLVTEQEIDKDKLYDAFVSYSHKDEDFVLNELLPILEQGPQLYKVCVHIRDWIAGEFIPKQIATSVAESRRTVVILSQNFLKSEWGKMEFRTAHTKAIQEGRARVILIIYGNMDINSDVDDELKAYLRTNIYVKWGDPWFWDKLRYALPHSREKRLRKTQNIMLTMNEKISNQLYFINGTSSALNFGCTPPTQHLLLTNNVTSGSKSIASAEVGVEIVL